MSFFKGNVNFIKGKIKKDYKAKTSTIFWLVFSFSKCLVQ